MIQAIAGAVFVSLALLAAGCGRATAPRFELNTEGRDPEGVGLAQRQAIGTALRDLFGTPDEPRVAKGVGLDPERLGLAAGPVAGEADGTRRGLYRRHCVKCHGVSGDGAGPLAATFDPYPRDFRPGTFKYTSTRAGAKPLREDLRRTLNRGIPATAMPSFAELTEGEIDALVEYVKYLSIRGQTEQYLFLLVVDEDEYLPLGVAAMDEVIEDGMLTAAWLWEQPQENRDDYLIVPPAGPDVDTPEKLAASIARGRELYAMEDAKCVECHGPRGAGDGETTDVYDDWNKPKKGVTPNDTARLAPWFKLPIRRMQPRDFRLGNFRGGNRPEDLYRRIHAGIKGTPMPAAGPSPGVPGVYTPEEIWHVVHYILSLAE